MSDEEEVCPLMLVESCYEKDGTPKRATGSHGPSLMLKLKEAEAAGIAALDWVVIARGWVDCFGRDGLKNAIRCANNALNYKACDHENLMNWWWIDGAETWIAIGAYESQYLVHAQDWLRRAEEFLVDSFDAGRCARVWMTISGPESAGHAFRLIKRAESLFDGSEMDQRGICRTWLHCFGREVGGQHVREFCLRIGSLPP